MIGSHFEAQLDHEELLLEAKKNIEVSDIGGGDRSDNRMMPENEGQPSALNRNHAGHSSMSSLYGKSNVSG